MNTDTLRMAASYGIATLCLLGSFVLLVFPSQVPPEQVLPFVTGIVGLVLGWVFNRESTNAGQRASERAVTLGSSTAQTGTGNGA